MNAPNNLLDFSTTSKVVKKNGKWVLEAVTVTKEYNPVFHKWEKKNTETKYLPLHEAEPSLLKEIEISILFKRNAIDTYSLKPLTAIFTQKIRAKALKDNPDEYLSVVDGKVFLHDLKHRVTQPLSMNDRRVQRLGKEKRITLKEAHELHAKGVSIFEESPTGNLSIRFES